MVTGPFTMGKTAGVWRLPATRAEIKERVELYFYYPTGSRLTLTLPFSTKRKGKLATHSNGQRFSLADVQLHF